MHSSSVMENFTDSGCGLVEDPGRKRGFLVFYLTIIIIAIPSNSFALYISWQHICRSNELGVYLFNLALSDLTISIGLALWVDFIWRGAWVHGGYVCLLCVYLLYTNFYTSGALLCCIAFDRYLAVVHPFKYPVVRRVGTAAGVSGAAWVLVICFNLATISWEDYFSEEGQTVVCFDVLPQSDNMGRVNVVRFVLGFMLPTLLVAFCNWDTFQAVQSNLATEQQERRRVSWLLAVVLLTMGVCFGPVHIMMLLRGLLKDCSSATFLDYSYQVTIAISALNCLADPLLYCFITKTGKASITQVVLCLLGRRLAHGQEVV